ncbi:MAG: AAA family ATPase, partial [Candidatus Enteromonas sp.]
MKIIQRPKYLNALIRSMGNGFPKVITGIRRCGKSYLLKDLFVSYLRNQGIADDEILTIDLDDDRNAGLRNPIALGEVVREWAKGKGRTFVFL